MIITLSVIKHFNIYFSSHKKGIETTIDRFVMPFNVWILFRTKFRHSPFNIMLFSWYGVISFKNSNKNNDNYRNNFYIFFAFLLKQYLVVLTCMLMIWSKYASIVYENYFSASTPSSFASHNRGVA